MWLAEIARATGGELHGPAGDIEVTRVSTDTRTIESGDCFVALRGERLDGHDYLDQAVARGAATLVVERYFPEHAGLAQIVVSDTLFALGEIARAWRLQNLAIPAVALAGSSGKTTTKEMAARIIGASRPFLATTGNLNNLIGLPHMLFQLDPAHKAAILELGMNTPGELQRLVEIVQPQCVCMTNITNAHIGKLGSQENLYQAKAEALRYSSENVTLLLNSDDPLSRRARGEYARGRRVISFGIAETADVHAVDVEPMKPYGYRFMLVAGGASAPVELRIFGRHNVYNALGAAAIATYFGIPPEEIAHSLSTFEAIGNRSAVEDVDGWTVVKDYYNASPAAVELALRSLADFNVSGRRFAVLADMLELGEMEESYHRAMGALAARSGIAKLFTLGDRGRWISEAASAEGLATKHCSSVEEVAAELRPLLRPGDLLLIKGSRLMKLEALYEILKG